MNAAKLLFGAVLGLLLSLSVADARPRGRHVVQEKIGQYYYLRACGGCHGPGKIGGNMATGEEWKALLSEHARELIGLHEGEANVTALIDYLKGPRFEREHERLLRFLQEFANDSESIPTCY
ncbi:c-type cytochrome [Nitratifractor sp.]